MKTSTFENRTKKVNKGLKGYQLAKMILEGRTESWSNVVRTCWTSGSGRFCKNMDYTEDTMSILNLAGLKKGVHFTLENDSPRGGKTGNYIQLTAKGRKMMIKD